jgi:hypothetical protein
MRCRFKTRFHKSIVLTAAASAVALPTPSQACALYVPPNLEDVQYADVVVIGRVSNYRIIRDEASRRRMLASPRLRPEDRRIYEDPRHILLPDYARFDVQVEEALTGNPPRTLSVTWDNSTFGEPEQMGAGLYLIALRWPQSASPPLRGPSTTITANPDTSALTLLQAPCSGAFIYEVGSEEAVAIRRIVNSRKQ